MIDDDNYRIREYYNQILILGVFPMAMSPVKCPFCLTTDVVKNGHYPNGNQRYNCKTLNAPTVYLWRTILTKHATQA